MSSTGNLSELIQIWNRERRGGDYGVIEVYDCGIKTGSAWYLPTSGLTLDEVLKSIQPV